ncbi:hypothetical protein [Sphingobacterium sp. GVS05A]|uniref:hypothetical protein n=1 Tax=Sphingobacterium sp. GVS05A TaxID=2862679 RepID=UPI001CBD1A63|nr:hypothetical protein [Sphingobacterium sp. GVS05A]
MNSNIKHLKNCWILPGFFGLMFTVLSCTGIEKSLQQNEQQNQQQVEHKLARMASAAGQLDSPMVKSLAYQVIVNNDTLGVWQETCYDLAQNGGQTDVHTALFNYVPGTQVKIICSSAFSNFTLSPKRLNIPVVKNGNELTFALPEYYNYALAIPGRAPLLLFGSPDYSAYKPGAVVFAKGIHHGVNGVFKLESNKTYYLEEGAILRGKVLIENVSNVKLIGRGYIDDRTAPVAGNFVKVYRSQNVELRGFGVRHAALGWQVDMVNSSNVNVSNLNLLSFGQNNDGLDLGSGCQDVHFSHCFIGSGDDGFGWHATNAAADGETPLLNCSAHDCMIWKNQVGVGIRIGSSLETSSVEQLTFKDIDIAKMTWGGHSVAIPHSDWADVRNITFEGIRDETIGNTRFVLMYIKQNSNSNPVYRPGTISNIRFIDCVSSATAATFEGYDAEHMIKDVTFKNVKVAGRNMLQSDIVANSFTSNITVVD